MLKMAPRTLSDVGAIVLPSRPGDALRKYDFPYRLLYQIIGKKKKTEPYGSSLYLKNIFVRIANCGPNTGLDLSMCFLTKKEHGHTRLSIHSTNCPVGKGR